MKALRLVLFGVVLGIFGLFSYFNWTVVPVALGSMIVDIRLPLVLLAAFVLGWLPTLLMHWAARSSWRRRLAKADRLLEDALSTGPRTTPVPAPMPLPSQAQPTVVPPAGA